MGSGVARRAGSAGGPGRIQPELCGAARLWPAVACDGPRWPRRAARTADS